MQLFRYTLFAYSEPDWADPDGLHETTVCYSYASSSDELIAYWTDGSVSESYCDVADISVIDTLPQSQVLTDLV